MKQESDFNISLPKAREDQRYTVCHLSSTSSREPQPDVSEKSSSGTVILGDADYCD